MSLFHRKPRVLSVKGCNHSRFSGTCPTCMRAKLARDRAMLDAVTKKRG